MIIHATRTRRVPRWYTRHVMRMVQRLVIGNPGFHRLVIRIDNAGTWETGYLVNPDVEPQIRRLIARVTILAPPVVDDDPWAIL